MTSPTTKPRYVKDPIHDTISITPRGWSFIDTRQFQRLRHLKQLGTSYNVWPGASHNRFEHCLGVGYLARTLAEEIQAKQPELGITQRDLDMVEIAGLCHDLGHGPWSHVWDGLFMVAAAPDCHWKHEEGSELMLDFLISENEIQISDEDRTFVKALIRGDHSRCPFEKAFLFDIVSNRRNGLDVDRFDYILRDSYMTGDIIKLNLARIFKSARVINSQICYNIKDVNQIYEICRSRFKLHKMIYNHKTAKAIEYMIVDALLLADPMLELSKRVFNPTKYVHLTDHIQTEIEQSDDPGLSDARQIFEKIHKRDLYKIVDCCVIPWRDGDAFRKIVTPQSIVAAVHELLESTDLIPREIEDEETNLVETVNLQDQDIIVDLSPMHYGMQEKNPLDEVRWYSNTNLDVCLKADPSDYSLILPDIHAEVQCSIFTRKPIFYGIIQKGYRHVLKTHPFSTQAQILPSLENSADDDMRQTPPLTSTQASRSSGLSRNASLTDISDGDAHPGNKWMTVDGNYSPLKKPRSKRRHSKPGSSSSTEASGSKRRKVD